MPAPTVSDVGYLANRLGGAVQLVSGASPWLLLVRKYHASTGGFADAWFSSSYFLNPYAIERGSLDDGTDIADGSKINIVNVEGQATHVAGIFRWVRDNATQPTISAQPPKGIMWGWWPDVRNGSRSALGFNQGAAGFRSNADTTSTYPALVGGMWAPLSTADGQIEVTFPTTSVFSSSRLGTSSTTANQTGRFLTPVEWLLRGASRIMFTPTGSVSAPSFSALPDDAQVICQFRS